MPRSVTDCGKFIMNSHPHEKRQVHTTLSTYITLTHTTLSSVYQSVMSRSPRAHHGLRLKERLTLAALPSASTQVAKY